MMTARRRPPGNPSSRDPVVMSLGYLMCLAPMAIAALVGWQALARPHRQTAAAAAPAALVASAVEKPVMTTAILRPRRESAVQAALEIPVPASQMAAIAFMPSVDATSVASLRRPRAEFATASTPSPRGVAPPAPVEPRGWRMETLRDVSVGEGLRLLSGGASLALAGVAPLDENAMCKRLDGVSEPCATRAANRLEILTRGRSVTCRVFDTPAGAAPVASCRADKIDLADDLVKNGLARRVAA